MSVINLDSALQEWWTPSLEGRAFEFHAFITHNGEDVQADSLANALSDLGLEIWYDGKADRDCCVVKAVSTALTRSRSVVVCVSDAFRDSPWCRAEYLPSLAVETLASSSRVVVAQLSPNAELPDALKTASRFSVIEPLGSLR